MTEQELQHYLAERLEAFKSATAGEKRYRWQAAQAALEAKIACGWNPDTPDMWQGARTDLLPPHANQVRWMRWREAAAKQVHRAEITIDKYVAFGLAGPDAFEEYLEGHRERVTNDRIAGAPPEKLAERLVERIERDPDAFRAVAAAMDTIYEQRAETRNQDYSLDGDYATFHDGSYGVTSEAVGREVRDRLAADPLLALERALEALTKAELFTPEQIIAEMDNRRLDRWLSESERHVTFLESLVRIARGQYRLEAIK